MATSGLAEPRGVLRPVMIAVAATGAVAYLGVVDPNQPGHYPACPFFALTGFACPGCGSLRAVHALAHGDPAEALARNPLAVVLLGYLVWAWAGWLRRSRTGGLPAPRPAPPWVIWSLFGVVVTFGVVRNLPSFSWLAP